MEGLLRDKTRPPGTAPVAGDQDGQQVVRRTPTQGCTAAVFKAVGMALPGHIKDAA